MNSSVERHETNKAGQYLRQLCRDFSGRTEAASSGRAGSVALSGGVVRFEASEDFLVMFYETRDAVIQRRQSEVINSHLALLAWRGAFDGMSEELPWGAIMTGGNQGEERCGV